MGTTHSHGHNDHDDHDHAHDHSAPGHSHVPAVIKHEKPLWIAFGLTFIVLLVEIAGGLLSNSCLLYTSRCV